MPLMIKITCSTDVFSLKERTITNIVSVTFNYQMKQLRKNGDKTLIIKLCTYDHKNI